MIAIAALILLIAFLLLTLLPFAWIKDRWDRTAYGAMASLLVAAVGAPFYLGGVIV